MSNDSVLRDAQKWARDYLAVHEGTSAVSRSYLRHLRTLLEHADAAPHADAAQPDAREILDDLLLEIGNVEHTVAQSENASECQICNATDKAARRLYGSTFVQSVKAMDTPAAQPAGELAERVKDSQRYLPWTPLGKKDAALRDDLWAALQEKEREIDRIRAYYDEPADPRPGAGEGLTRAASAVQRIVLEQPRESGVCGCASLPCRTRKA